MIGLPYNRSTICFTICSCSALLIQGLPSHCLSQAACNLAYSYTACCASSTVVNIWPPNRLAPRCFPQMHSTR